MTQRLGLSRTTIVLLLLAIWAVICSWQVILNWHNIVLMFPSDPDDVLRLVQVRDLLGGQSWFDLTQYRLHPPGGVPMHWSRLVDLPIAVMLAALKPLLGVQLAEHMTVVMVPLLQILLLVVLTYAIARRLDLSQGTALLSVAMLAVANAVLLQFRPLRIDHHSAQILAGAVAMWAILDTWRRDGRSGTIAGVAMACWLQISLEGLPYAVVMGAMLAVWYLLHADRWPDFRNYLIALTGASLVLLFGTHYPADASKFWCDTFSPAFQLPLVVVCVTVLASGSVIRGSDMARRALPLLFGGIAGGAVFLLTGRQCVAGPFGTLPPVVHDFWYLGVMEGLPVWAQDRGLQGVIIIPPILGLVGSVIGWKHAARPEHRVAWVNLLVMQVVSYAISLDVMRAMSYAQLLALPGNAVLVARLGKGAQALRIMPLRVILVVGIMTLLTPLGAYSVAMVIASAYPGKKASVALASINGSPSLSFDERCFAYNALRGLDALPPSLLFTPLDIGAHILAYTHHSVVATGHHRNVKGMEEVISGMLATPDEARAIVAATGAQYVALCGRAAEVVRYTSRAPNGLAAMLSKNEHPDWLVPVEMRPGETIRVYRVVYPPS